jgi:hypothetical protein
MLESFRPDYIVLREDESKILRFLAKNGWTKNYKGVKHFKANPLYIKNIFLIEKNIDLSFILLKKLEEVGHIVEKLGDISDYDVLYGSNWGNNGGYVQGVSHIGSFSGSDSYKGKIISKNSFVIDAPYLTFRAAGRVDGKENMIELVDERGRTLKSMEYIEPGEQWQDFLLDVSDLQGQNVRLALTDNSVGFRGWFAISDIRLAGNHHRI